MKKSDNYKDTLYTVDKEGHRRWVYSSSVRGTFFKYRAVVYSILLVFYLAMPWVTINGKQGVLLNIPDRRFIFFGQEFWATDTILLFLFLGVMGLSLFFFTSVLGRVWCGWACPQTVFLEFVFRPIERWIEGSPEQRKRLDRSAWTAEKIKKKGLKYFLYSVVAWVMASTTIAYFTGREPLLAMMAGSPLENLGPFILTLVMMGLLLFEFGWFREQFCTVLCPYARFQSVLMDSESLVVGYDRVRGEPRGKVTDKENGDCVDCGLCVRVCPTGIDIRNGLQLECVACTACIDACDSIMEKVGRPKGLIRYDTENKLLGKAKQRHLLRPRPVIYGTFLLIFSLALGYQVFARPSIETQVVRTAGNFPFQELPDGRLVNQLELEILNKSQEKLSFKLSVVSDDGFEIISPVNQIAPSTIKKVPFFVNFNPSELKGGRKDIIVQLETSDGLTSRSEVTLLGPGK